MSGRDSGLQPERTALSWQRTALSLVVAAAIVTRLTVGALGPVVVLVLGLCLVQSVQVFLTSGRSYASRSGDAATGHAHLGAVGRSAALLCAQVVLLSLAELATLLIEQGR